MNQYKTKYLYTKSFSLDWLIAVAREVQLMENVKIADNLTLKGDFICPFMVQYFLDTRQVVIWNVHMVVLFSKVTLMVLFLSSLFRTNFQWTRILFVSISYMNQKDTEEGLGRCDLYILVTKITHMNWHNWLSD